MCARRTKKSTLHETSAARSLTAVRRIARKVDPEPSHAFQVCRLAELLFDRTRNIHHLDDSARRLLTAGALLHDNGHTISMQGHHKHARDLIMTYDLPGFSDREKAMVASIARYHRKAHPNPSHQVFGDLNSSDQHLVRQLAAILRIADGLDRAHDAAVRDVRVSQSDEALTIHAILRRPSPTDIWGGLRKRGLFEEVFELKVEIDESNESTKPCDS